MRKSGKISGTVTYTNEKNQRLPIPRGPCMIEEYDLPNKNNVAASIWWTDKNGKQQKTDLNEKEWAQYKSEKDFIIDD